MDSKQHIAIFTTASLPWMTGTAVNPLFRVAYLTKGREFKVTLVIPWLSPKDQELVYPNKIIFKSPSEQEAYVCQWLGERTGFVCDFSIKFYPGKVIRLSAATQDLPRSIICNVHGVNPKFLEIGKRKNEHQQNGDQAFSKGAYYIGKMAWSKGYKELLKLLHDHRKELTGLEVDLYGNGEDSDQVQEAAKKLELDVRVHPGHDHADPLFHDYKVFLNPSTTDVLCTTTAEALAMGKIVVCANHPSNDFFKQFSNCRTYQDSSGFVKETLKTLSEEPAQLTATQMHELSWDAATERFLQAVGLDQVVERKPTKTPPKKFMSMTMNLRKNMDDASAYVHYVASGIEASRRVFGAIPGSLQPDEEQRQELGWAFRTGDQG